MNKLFVSYRSLDSSKVDNILAELRSNKDVGDNPRFSPWQDKTNIPAGHDWWDAIVSAIIDCEFFVFMVSRESVKNGNCRAELSYARKRNRPIIPLVLEGEFSYNPTTGKNDIDYWADIPQELNDLRAQFLFYEGTSFVSRLDAAIAEFLRAPQRWRDIPAERPPDPRDASDATNNTITLYDEACDYAWRCEFDTAERLFLKLVNLGDSMFGEDAYQWIHLLRQYKQLVVLDMSENTRHKVISDWISYRKLYPKRFTDFFDPKDFQTRFGNSILQSSAPSSNASFDSMAALPTSFPVTALTDERRNSSPFDNERTVRQAIELMNTEKFKEAIFLLESLQRFGYTSKSANIGELLELARKYQAQLERLHTAKQRYVNAILLFNSHYLREQGINAFRQWRDEYPDLIETMDSENLRSLITETPNTSLSPVPALLPSPFEWITIPAGDVTLVGRDELGSYIKKGEKKTRSVPFAFAIAKYPISNAQYARFMEVGGYENKEWWTDEGWHMKLHRNERQPRYWHEKLWNKSDFPVVGVTWYEALAFCQWLSAESGENITLPTEEQWQRAARALPDGNDSGYKYPWGNEWNSDLCTHGVPPEKYSSTTSVLKYGEKGASPLGVVDMSGNVWEWCLTKWDTGKDELNGENDRTLRGGSWLNETLDWFLTTSRRNAPPLHDHMNVGFRILRSL